MFNSRTILLFLATFAFVATLTAFGCRPVPPELSTRPLPVEKSSSTEQESLQQRIDRVLEYTLENRRLDVSEQAAWQILHGNLAFGRDFPMRHNGKDVPVIEYLAAGGQMNGWTIQRGNRLVSADGEDLNQYGMRAVVEPGTRAGQGHYDQWLAILSQCDLKPHETFLVGDQTYTMTNFLQQVQLDTSRNVANEFSWTIIGLTRYFPTDHHWTDSTGKAWNIERLVEIETEQGLDSGACGGTHRLIGLAMTLNKRREEGKPISGVWADAEKLIREVGVANAKSFQNPDGSFSANYFRRPGISPDLADNLGTSGHTLEFLSIAMDAEELKQRWVEKGVEYLCDLFDRTQDLSMECGALYHAAHGLALYRERVYGPRTYSVSNNQDTVGAK